MPLFPSKQQHHAISTRDISAPLPIHHSSPPPSSQTSPASGSRIPNTTAGTDDPQPQIATFIDYARYTFAPTSIPLAPLGIADHAAERAEEEGYGCMRGVGKGVKLGLKELGEVVRSVAKELGERGLDTPFLFSNQALDLSPGKIRAFIQSYIATLTSRPASTQSITAYRNNLRLCQPYELAWFLRWALGRVVRLVREEHVSPGADRSKLVDVREREVRGLVDWAEYEIWRGKERAKHFPETFVDSFFAAFPPDLSLILQILFTLLSRLTAHSHISGLTPVTLSSLFGPLIFGLEDASFTATHTAYIRAAGATEHLLLAFIRAQAAAHDRLKGDFPRTLREWIQGYPTAPGMIITDRELDLGLPRKGVRAVAVHMMQRNVRSYTRDLIKSHVDWVAGYETQLGTKWRPWENVVGKSVAKSGADLPVVTETYRLRLRLKSIKTLQSPRSSPAGRSNPARGPDDNVNIRAAPIDDEWGLFEDSGFDPGNDFKEKLRFDLSEGAKQQVTSKRMTMTWDDFTSPSGGFDRTPSALADSLAITQPLVQEHLQHWPEERDELRKKLRKGYKELPSFDAYEHRFRVDKEGENGSGIWVQEPFLDVWADLLLSGGWMETDELTYRPANWVIVEYQKKRATPSSDIASSVFVFEEFVPSQYQDALRHPKVKRLGIFKRFPRRSDQGESGHKKSPNSGKDANFDVQIRKGNYTKVVTLSKPTPTSSSVIGSPPPISPQTPQSDRQYRSFDTQTSPTDRSPSSKRTSSNFRDRLNKVSPKRSSIQGHLLGSCTNLQVRTMLDDDGDGCRYPTKGTDVRSDDRDRWIGLLAANGARAMAVETSPPAVQHVSHLATPGFRVLSRSASMSPPGSYTPVTSSKNMAHHKRRVTYQSVLPSGTFQLASRSESPSPPLSFVISTKPSSDTLPEGSTVRREPTALDLDLKRVARPTLVPDHTLRHGGKSIHSMAAQVNSGSSRFIEVLQNEVAYTHLRHESTCALNGVFQEPAAPVQLGRPLPLPSAYAADPMHRDTVFSVIDGYATHRSDTASSLGRYEPGWENVATDDIFSAKPLPKVDHNASYSTILQPRDSGFSAHSNAELELISDINDYDDSSSTWDLEEEHGDDTASGLSADRNESDLASDGFEPPPNLATIEAIARQPSPGRYPNGVPLNFVHEESEWDTSDSEGNYRSALSAPQSAAGTWNRLLLDQH
ncbi:hypothetical protein QFC22_005677 [Naganishia vaughanmartiniae]|uniref:Uncharacterized protein n=1 Tax=Naganishia vaughanmartiniae TaxID=1424756 RepID=A0ACC2WSR1_9TREE|nr:hypothetical protein QFC22_005677 [Naganishia vaughanmartiniae]